MTSIGGDELVIVFGEGEGLGHLLVREPPITVGVVQVVASVLKPDPKRAFLFLADESGIDVTAADIGEAANVADDLAEEVGPLPSDGEGADAAGTCSADNAAFGVFGEGEIFTNFGEDFGLKHSGVGLVEGVVFDTAVAGFRFFSGRPILSAVDSFVKDAGVDEDPDRDGNFATVDEVIEHDGGAGLAFFIDVGMAILKDHHSGGFGGLVLGGNVKVVLAQGSLEDLTAMLVARDLTHRNAFLTLRIPGESGFGEKSRACDKCEGQKERFYHSNPT